MINGNSVRHKKTLLIIFFLMISILNAEGRKEEMNNQNVKIATFAGGCFWCMQPPYDNLKGVVSTKVGYSGGSDTTPTYQEVTQGNTGHLEAVQIFFDPEIISFSELLDVFWRNIDPTVIGKQFADLGSQYQTAIFYHDDIQKSEALISKNKLEESGIFKKPIVTKILSYKEFFDAEEYHQKYYKKNASHYKMYKKGSGREGYLKRMWGDKSKK